MRVAALYDIHGNDAALAAVLAEVEDLAVDLIVIGGDVAGGPFPGEAVEAVRALGDRAVVIRGNGERELVESAAAARLRPRADRSGRHLVDAHPLGGGGLARDQLEWLGGLPPYAVVDVDGLGEVLFCHGSPRSDEEIVTRALAARPRRADARRRGAAAVVLGHTHVQFDRAVGGTARSSTPAASGMPYEAGGGVLGAARRRMSSCAAPAYDVDASAARIRAERHPGRGRVTPTGSPRPPGAAEASEFFERMATRPPPASM